MDGARINKAEIQLQLPALKGQAVVAHLREGNSIELPQIVACFSYVNMAVECIRRIRCEQQVSSLYGYLTDVIEYCKRAIDALVNSENMYSMTPAAFSDTPPDLSISFGVQNARIVACAFISPHSSSSTHLGSHSQSSSHSIRSMSSSSTSLAAALLQTSGNISARVDSIVPALTASYEILSHCIRRLNQMRNQMAKILHLEDISL